MATEKRLIDAHELWSDIMMLPHNGDMISSEEVEKTIMDAHIVDAVKVVRCKDCKHWLYQYGRCLNSVNGWMPHRNEDDFCSYGERRTDG